MSFKILISMFFLLLVILLAPPPSLIQSNFDGLVVAAIKPLVPIQSNSNPSNYVPVRAYKKGHGGAANGFGSHIVESCLPKGFRLSSAPSHYVNGQTFGSELCSSSKRMNRP